MASLAGLEAIGWVVFLTAVVARLARVVAEARARGAGSALAAVVAGALAVRLLVPWAPTHWYYTGGNVLGAPGVFHQMTTRVPWIDRLIAFDLGLAWRGLVLAHLAAGLASIVLLWGALLALGAPARTRDGLAWALALTPVYVRYAVTDSSHIWIFCCFAAAASALAECTEERPARVEPWVLLVIAPLLGAPVRVESAPLLGAAALFVLVVSPRARLRRAALVVFVIAACVAIVIAARAHHKAVGGRLRFDPAAALLGVLFRAVLHAPSPLPVSFFPPLLAVPVLYLAAQRARGRRRLELFWMGVASLYCAGPFLFGQFIFFELGGAGYSIVSLAFPSLWAAEGTALAIERIGARLRGAPMRGALAAFALMLGASFVPAWFRTFAFMEEHKFLREELRGRRGTVLALFDDNDACGHDMDAPMGLPDAVLSVMYPDLHWVVLSAGDTADVRGVRFDYYYRGLELELDPSSMEGRYQRMVNPEPESRRCHAEQLARLRELDARIRAAHGLEVIARERVVARTFSFIAFPGDRAELTLFRTTGTTDQAAAGDQGNPGENPAITP